MHEYFVSMCVHVPCVCCVLGGQKRALDLLGVESLLIVSWQCAGNWAQVLWKSSKCLSQGAISLVFVLSRMTLNPAEMENVLGSLPRCSAGLLGWALFQSRIAWCWFFLGEGLGPSGLTEKGKSGRGGVGYISALSFDLTLMWASLPTLGSSLLMGKR